MLVQGFLESSAQRTPDKIALVCGERRVSYQELDLAANRLAHALRASGIQRGDRVAILDRRMTILERREKTGSGTGWWIKIGVRYSVLSCGERNYK